MTTDRWTLKSPGLRVTGGYIVFATALAIWSAVRGDGGQVAVAAYAGLMIVIVIADRHQGSRWAVVVLGWFPLLVLPVLYAMIPRTAIAAGPFDSAIQHWDRVIFRSDAARTFAGEAPWKPLSELLHAAYLSYYAIIFVPPLVMYLRGDMGAFARTVSAFAVAMSVCFAVFCLLPVEGPRYLWPPPSGVPDGPFRRIALLILEKGSSRGTAFPSSHEAIALATSLSSVSWDRRVGLSLLFLAILLGLGAVYGGFHYGSDMVFGSLVGVAAWALSGRRRKVGPA
jgi:membrane-associated phospholipid phosphatase